MMLQLMLRIKGEEVLITKCQNLLIMDFIIDEVMKMLVEKYGIRKATFCCLNENDEIAGGWIVDAGGVGYEI